MNRNTAPMLVLAPSTRRETGRRAQMSNIQAGKAVSSIVRTTLGPRSMLKMLLDPMGGITLTNDGNAILREVDVAHPAAKSIIELSRAQDEEVGDGTTSVVILAGEMLSIAEAFLKRKMHPTIVVSAYMMALDDMIQVMEDVSVPLDLNDEEKLIEVITASVGTKFSSFWTEKISRMALQAVKCVCIENYDRKEIDIKRYAKVEKIPGGDIEDSHVLRGVMLNKDITHPAMRRHIENPKVILLDCPLEYKKGESQTNVEITKEEDWAKLLKQEEIEVEKACADIIKTGCNVVVTEKGVSDLASHFLLKAGISVIRRARKTDNNRIARVTGATIVNRTEELLPRDMGTKCGLFQIKLIGDEYFCSFEKCEDPKACTIVLRGGTKDVLNEVERNLADALNVARNIVLEPKLLPGGGATEMEISARLKEKSKSIEGIRQWPYLSLASTPEVIPETLIQNCGSNIVRTLTDLRSRHAVAGEGKHWGIDGITGEVVDVTKRNIWDTFSVKQQVYKSAIEAAATLIRIDDILSGVSSKKDKSTQVNNNPQQSDETGQIRG